MTQRNDSPTENVPENEEERDRMLRPPTPTLWTSYLNIVYTLVVCGVCILISLQHAVGFAFADFGVVVATVVVANFVEYGVHRYPLHQPMRGGDYVLRLHMDHHNYFYQKAYCIAGFRDYGWIVFPPIVVNAVFLMALPLAWVAGTLFGSNAMWISFATVFIYYLVMQLIHVICHFSKDNPVSKMPGIQFLWRHHYIHHDKRRMAHYNFNFVVPMADFVFGTTTQEVDPEGESLQA